MDDARLDLLVRDCWPRLVRRAYLWTGEQQAAHDLAGEALARRPAEARTEDALQDQLLSQALRRAALFKPGSAPFPGDGDGREPVLAALRRLTLDERVVLVLRHQDGWAAERIESRLRLSDTGRYKREKRALKALRESGVVPPDAEADTSQLKALLDAVAARVSPSPPPDVPALRRRRVRRRWARLALFGAVAAAVIAGTEGWPF